MQKETNYHFLVSILIEFEESDVCIIRIHTWVQKAPFLFFEPHYTVAVDGQGCFKLNELTDKFFAIHFALKPSLSYLLSYNYQSENNHYKK